MSNINDTKKTTELAEQRKELEKMNTPEVGDDEKAVDEFLKSKGYLTKEDLEREKKAMEASQQMDRFFDNNPDLKSNEAAIRAIAKTDNSALEDIVVKYNFSTTDKLAKAKGNRQIVGDVNKEQPKQKSIKDMSAAEYEKWKAEQGYDKPVGSFSD